ncbi:hypothetical protein JCM11641_005899 [Rhodosporidiobolus odoratus]
MTRSHRSQPETQHQKLSSPGYKKHGGGSANWGSNDDVSRSTVPFVPEAPRADGASSLQDIREGVEIAREGGYVPHPPQNDDTNHKLSISPLQSPAALDEDKEKELKGPPLT